MSKRLKKTRKITLGGEDRELTVTMAALWDIEEQAGINLLSGDEISLSEFQHPKRFSATLWALLGGEDSGLTIREVGKMITLDNMDDLSEALFALLRDDSQDEGGSKNAGKGK
jgi:hypothetical protein